MAVEQPYSSACPPIKPSHRRLHVHDTADTPCVLVTTPRQGSSRCTTPEPRVHCLFSPAVDSLLLLLLLPPTAVFPSESYCIHPATPSTLLYNTSAAKSHPIPHPFAYKHITFPPHTYIYLTHTQLRTSASSPSSPHQPPVFSESPQNALVAGRHYPITDPNFNRPSGVSTDSRTKRSTCPSNTQSCALDHTTIPLASTHRQHRLF